MLLPLLWLPQVSSPADLYRDDDRAAYLTDAFKVMIEVSSCYFGSIFC
jgi:hypothetical protein